MFAFSQVLPLMFQLLGPLIALVIVLASARGRAKGLGAAGAALMLLAGLGNGLLSMYLPVLMKAGGFSVASVSLLFLPLNLIGVIGLVLLALAVVAGGRARSGGPVSAPGQPSKYDLR